MNKMSQTMQKHIFQNFPNCVFSVVYAKACDRFLGSFDARKDAKPASFPSVAVKRLLITAFFQHNSYVCYYPTMINHAVD